MTILSSKTADRAGRRLELQPAPPAGPSNRGPPFLRRYPLGSVNVPSASLRVRTRTDCGRRLWPHRDNPTRFVAAPRKLATCTNFVLVLG